MFTIPHELNSIRVTMSSTFASRVRQPGNQQPPPAESEAWSALRIRLTPRPTDGEGGTTFGIWQGYIGGRIGRGEQLDDQFAVAFGNAAGDHDTILCTSPGDVSGVGYAPGRPPQQGRPLHWE